MRVTCGFVCYTRSKYKVLEIPFDDVLLASAERTVQEVTDVIRQGYLPRATSWTKRCADCCYRNICIQ